MYIDDAEDLIPKINQLRNMKVKGSKLNLKRFDYVVRVRKWHHSNHVSFHSNNP